MDKYLQSLKILREKFIEENDELLEKIKESEKTGEFKITSVGQFDQFYMRDFLKVFSLPNFHFLELLQLYEELLYLYHFFDYDNFTINTKDFFKDGVFQKESFLKSADSAIEIIIAKKDIESHVKKLAEEIGIFNLDTSQQADNFVSLKQYLTAIEKAKNKKLYHSGDEEFLVSKIPINGKGFIENNLKIDNRVFYTSKSEHIIAMARVSRPGIYLIANIPYEKYANAGFYILFVTEGDCYLVDNNIHAFRSFLSRSEDRLMERRTDGTFLPWEIISDFIEKRSEDKTLTDTISDFSFRVIGNLSTVNHTDIFGLTALIDTCLYTFTKTDFLKESSVALKASMIDINFLSKPENMPLTVYKQNVPSISSLDLTWKPEKFELPEKTSGDYLVPFLEKLPIEKINLDLTRDELTSLKQIERNLSFQLRKQSAKILEEKLKNDHKRNWEKVRERLRIFIQKRFAENPIHYFMKILEDREYSYEAYKGFGTRDEEKFKSEETMTEKEKILSIYCDHETIHGTHHNVYYAMSDRNFHFVEFSGCRNRYFPCASCRKNGKLEYVLTIRDVQQFIKFFELTEEEIKHLPKQMMNYLNQARCHYNGNHILEDLDPVSLINNPWWVSSNGRDDPQITLSLALCKFCKKRYEK